MLENAEDSSSSGYEIHLELRRSTIGTSAQVDEVVDPIEAEDGVVVVVLLAVVVVVDTAGFGSFMPTTNVHEHGVFTVNR